MKQRLYELVINYDRIESLKDLGKKPAVSEVEPWFGFSRMDSLSNEVLNKIK